MLEYFFIMRSLLVVFVLGLAGCSALERSEERGTESRLRQAGFRIVPATPADLAKIPSYKVEGKMRAGRVIYHYADPRRGRLYEGGSEEYERYREITLNTQERRVTNLAQIGPRRTTGPLLW
jgi:hypothetical protein